MHRRTLAVIVGAIVLFVVAVVGAMAFTGGESSGDNVHTMQNGSTMSDDEMDMMSEAMGADLDRMFLETMIRHHQGAIRMAEVELEEGSNADVLALAQGIIDGQQAEIDQMQSMLEDI